MSTTNAGTVRLAQALAAVGVACTAVGTRPHFGPMPGAVVDICYPGDPTALLPEGAALEGYDGIAITGSSLHIYHGGAEVMRQVELVRAALTTGTPLFGSCWGLQVITAAAKGASAAFEALRYIDERVCSI